MQTVSVKVRPDHLESMSRVRKPILAIAELIWNGFDADATEVRVKFIENYMGGLECIIVSDNGHGLGHHDAVPAFENLGGSWKRHEHASRSKKRMLHGKAGKGRFRAFALGKNVCWKSRFNENGCVREYQISGSRLSLGTFEISEPTESSFDYTGMDVEITGVERNFPSLRGNEAIQTITEHFALYSRKYSDISIIYDDIRIDPSSAEKHVEEYNMDVIALSDGRRITPTLIVIEWNAVAERALVLCDSEGFALAEVPPGIRAPGFAFTAYLKSEYLRDLDQQGSLVLEELHPDLKLILDSTKTCLRDHFRKRAAEVAVDLVKEWKKKDLYPYKGEPQNILEETERQVFDVCALNINTYSEFEELDIRSQRLALRLLQQALGTNPTAVQRILEDVLDLPSEKQEELADLLQKTTLAAIINASRTIANRLEFLRGLEILVFNPEIKNVLRERGQLHYLLAENTWLFGEEYNLTVDDQSLTEVLKKHIKLLGRDICSPEPVLRDDGTIGRVDLMLSRLVPLPNAEEREHLVIELKRPKQIIDPSISSQIKSYAFAVAGDERFRDTSTRWIFWAISNEIADPVRKESKQRNRPPGLLYDDDEGRITIWVKTWGEILQQCEARLKFFQERLQYCADHDSALVYLRKTHEKYLPDILKNSMNKDKNGNGATSMEKVMEETGTFFHES